MYHTPKDNKINTSCNENSDKNSDKNNNVMNSVNNNKNNDNKNNVTKEHIQKPQTIDEQSENTNNEYLENTGIYIGKILSGVLDTTTTTIQTCMTSTNVILSNCKKESSSSINRFLDLFKQK